MVVSVAVRRSAGDDVVVFLANVEFATDDRLDSYLVGGVHEMHRAKDISVVGHGHGGHAQLMHTVDKFFDIAGAVEQGVIAVQMQVDELVLRHEGSTWQLILCLYFCRATA